MQYKVIYDKSLEKPKALYLVNMAQKVFFTGTILAMIIYPGYNIQKKYLSELGADSRSQYFFNITIFLTSAMLLPAFILLYNNIKSKVSDGIEIVLKFGLFSSLMAMVALFMVGYFPAKYPTLQLHTAIALTFMILLGLTFFLFTLVLLHLQAKEEFSEVKLEDYIGLMFLPLVVLFSDLTLWYSQLLQKFIVYVGLIYLVYLMNRFYDLNKDKRIFYEKEKFKPVEAHSIDQVLILNRIYF